MGRLAGPYSFACDDPLEFDALFHDCEHEVLQISGGRFGFREIGVRLPGLTVGLVNFSQHCELKEITASPVISFLFVMSADNPFRSAGCEMTAPHLVIQRPGEEHAFIFGGPTEALFIQVDESLATDMGWKMGPHRHFAMSGQDFRPLSESCSNVLSLRGKGKSPARHLDYRARTLQNLDQLLHSLGALGASGSNGGDGGRSTLQTIRRAKTELHHRPFDAPLDVGEIAESLGMSERHFHREFKRWAGIGPARYFELMRLHALRAYLSHGDGKFNRVSAAAQKFGFSNPGRMAMRYGNLFSELPGETARRARQDLPRTCLPVFLKVPGE